MMVCHQRLDRNEGSKKIEGVVDEEREEV